MRTRLRDAIGRTVLCGNAEEHVKNGAGQKYVFFDADFYKEVAQRAFLSQVGASGSCSLYEGTKDEHTEFAIQVCNERLRFVQHRAGRDFYTWATKEPHDYLDCMAMCHAVAASQGMTGINFTGSSSVRELPNARTRRRAKPKIKVI